MKPIIRVEKLGKQYQIGARRAPYGTLRESIVEKLRAPLRWGRRQGHETVWALKDVSFAIAPGEVVGVIGRNGAGKSTLLKLLSRVTEPSSGRAQLYGRVGSLLEVGTGFHPELSGRDNIFLNGAILGMRRHEIRRKFDEIVSFAGVDQFIDTPVKRYSSGMYMRLAFAVAAHLEPEILVVDEVLAVGDIAFQKKCLGKMDDISRTGRTVIFVSHDMTAIRHLCRRCILLGGGQVIQDGPSGKVVHAYHEDLRQLEIGSATAVGNTRFRRGSGEVRFTSIRVCDEQGQSTHDFQMGETVCFELNYRAFAAATNLFTAVYLKSMGTGDFVTSACFPLAQGPLAEGTQGEVVIKFPRANLRPGEYQLYFWLGSGMEDSVSYDTVDGLSGPLMIRTEKSVYELGFDPSRPCGVFSIEARLEVKK